MNAESKFLITVFLFCVVVVLIVAFILFRKRKEKAEVKRKYPKVVNIVLDDFEDALS